MDGQDLFEQIWVATAQSSAAQSSAVIDNEFNINHDLGSDIADPISTDTQVYFLYNNP